MLKKENKVERELVMEDRIEEKMGGERRWFIEGGGERKRGREEREERENEEGRYVRLEFWFWFWLRLVVWI